MAEPKEIGTVWTLGCEVFVEDALTAEVQEIKVNDIVLSANIFTEGLSVEVGSDMVNAMDLDVRISMDGLKTYIIDSQIVPYEEVLKITDFSQEATNEKRYAASALSAKKIYDKTGVLESGLSALKKRVDEIELNGVGGSGDSVWKIDEQGNIWTDKQVIIKNNLIVEGDTSSGGEGEDTPSAGLDETRLQEYLDEHKYVTEDDIAGLIPSNVATIDYVNTKFNSIDLSPYAKTTELDALANRVVPIETWMDNVGQHITYDAELDAIVINHNLIVTKDTSSGGEGQDTPASGIRGIYVNGTPYTDTDGDGFIDLGTVSGGGGVSGDYLPLTGGRITGNSLDIGREDNYASAFVKIITNASTSADYGTSIRHYEKSSGSYTYKGLLIDKNGAYYSNNGSNYDLIHSGNYSSFALPLSGGTITGNLTLNQYLRINAWSGYGSGSANVWYNGSTKRLLWENATDMAFGTNIVIHSGNIGSHKAGGLATPRTIWGQSFDGTGNVSGNLYLGTGTIRSSNSGTDRVFLDFGSAGDPYIGYGTASAGIDSHLCGNTIYLHYGTSRTIGFLLNSSGNVGIGTTSPADKLHVDGRIRMRSVMLSHVSDDLATSGSYLLQYYTPSNKLLALTSRSGSTSAYKNYIFTSDWSNGHIGLCNVPSPDYSVYVTGSLGITGAVTMSSTLTVGDATNTSTISGTYVTINTTTSGGWERAIRFQQNGSDKFCLGAYGTGSVMYYGYIGASYTAPWVKFTPTQMTVNGDAIITGDTSSGSDIRFKDIIKDKTIKIADIAKAPLFTFKWNDRGDDTIHLGSSAQYWEKVCPWLVTGEDFKSLNYATLGVAMGISLAKKAVNHEARIKELEKEIKRLKEEMRYGDR